MKLTKSIVAAAVLSALAVTANAAGKNSFAQIQVVRTSLAQAKTLAAYNDGTNVLLANWSHEAVDIEIPELNRVITLDPINSGSNVYLVQSGTSYYSVHFTVSDDNTGEFIANGIANNPSTVEINDGSNRAAHAKVSVKAGI